MTFKNKKVFSPRLLVFNSIIFLLIIYFTYHSFSGDRGLLAFINLKNNLIVQKQIMKDLIDERISLENTVRRLNPKTLDKDMLDEVARRELGLIGVDEQMIVFTDTK